MEIHRLQGFAGSHVDEAEHQENAEEQEAGCGDDSIDGLLIAQVHEKQSYQNRFDRRDEERDDHVSGAEIDVRRAYGDAGQDQERDERGDEYASMIVLMCGFVASVVLNGFGMGAHLIK